MPRGGGSTSGLAAGWRRMWTPSPPSTQQNALFFSHPFRAPQRPRDYVVWAFADQAHAECRFGEPVVAGDRAAVDWWAVVTATDGAVESLAGTSLLRFDESGLVVEQRDVWAGERRASRAERLGSRVHLKAASTLACREALPRHDLRLPDERSRLRANQGHARVPRSRRGDVSGNGRRRRLQHVHRPREAGYPARRIPRKRRRTQA